MKVSIKGKSTIFIDIKTDNYTFNYCINECYLEPSENWKKFIDCFDDPSSSGGLCLYGTAIYIRNGN